MRLITPLYSHDDHQHEVRAATMDALDAVISIVILTFAATAAINYYGADHQATASKLFGYYHSDLIIDWNALLPLGVMGLTAFTASLAAIVASSYSSGRIEPKRRPIGRTIVAVMAAIVISVIVAMLLDRSSGLGAIVDGLTFILPALMPAAMRLTTKEAFTQPAANLVPVGEPA